jgi:hypothetical protein
MFIDGPDLHRPVPVLARQLCHVDVGIG